MKEALVFFSLFIFSATLVGQSYFRVKVVDSNTRASIQGAIVYVEEIPIADKSTDENGLVSYQNIPSDRKVRLNVRKAGYIPQSVEVVANLDIGPDNNIVISLDREKSQTQLIIWGEVIDNNENDIPNASVELNLAGKIYNTIVDKGGNYSFRVPINESSNISYARIQVNADNCTTYRDDIPLTKEEIINYDAKMNCDNIVKDAPFTAPNRQRKTILINEEIMNGQWLILFTEVELQNNMIICKFKITSQNKDRDLGLYGGWASGDGSMIYDCFGNAREGSASSLSNDNRSQLSKALMLSDTPIDASITFENFPSDCNQILLLEMYFRGDDLPKRKIQFRNIPLK